MPRIGHACFVVSLVIGSLACGTSKADRDTSTQTAATPPADAGLCARWPKSAETYDASGPTGCSARATILVNDQNVCDGGTEYGLVCTGPGKGGLAAPGLGCKDVLLPGVAEYCCPCRD